MAAPVFLIAGAGPGTRRREVRFHADAVRATGKKAPTIAYVGAAANDSLAFEKLISLMVFGRRATVVPVRLKRRSVATSTARALLADADLVFFTGGDVELGMQLIGERGLGPYLRELHHAGKVMEGISAGAMMLGRRWVRFPGGGDGARAEPFDCLGLVPHSFDCHAEEDDWSELRALARLVPDESVVYGIAAGGAVRWDGELTALGMPLVRVRCGASPKTLSPLAPRG